MSDTLFDLPPGAPGAPGRPGQWRLAEVQIANWGTFDGAIYRIPIARRGHLLTGPSGSGKSSLLDAVAAVLTPDKWLRLNQAAQGTGSRDDQRTLYSYVRGAWSRTVDEAEDRVVSAYLRPRATWSGIVLRFDDGTGSHLCLARIFFARASATSSADVSDLCLLERSPVDLRDLEEFAVTGLEARKLQRVWPEALVTTNGSHGRFYARLRTLFGIPHESALQLLHKTQSAKSLDSLDQLFRDYMLERPGTFDLADNAVEQFGELRAAHDRVVELREQRDHLLGLREHAERHDLAQDAASSAFRLIESVGPYLRRRGLTLAIAELESVQEEVDRLGLEAGRAARAEKLSREAAGRAERRVAELGGAEIEHLQERIGAASDAAADVATRWERFARELGRAGVAHAPADAAQFAELIRAIDQELAEPEPEAVGHDDLRRLAVARDHRDAVSAAIDSIRSTGSTVPGPLLETRSTLAAELGLAPSALPFAAELIEVLPDHARWTGAVERVLRPLSLAMLVRPEHLGAVRRWVDAHRVRGRLVFEEVATDAPRARPARAAGSLVHKIAVRDGPFAAWLNGQLSERFDFACVEKPDELDDHVRAVTLMGQVKTSRTRYEKDDRRRIDDRSQWVLGDREGKLEALVERLVDAEESYAAALQVVERAEARRQAVMRRRTILEGARSQGWADIDRDGAAARVLDLESQVRALTLDSPDLADAEAVSREARGRHEADREVATEAMVSLRTAQGHRDELQRTIGSEQAEFDAGAVPPVDGPTEHHLDERFRAERRHLTRQNLAETGQQVTRRLVGERDAAQTEARRAGEALVGAATSFNDTWPAAAAAAELVATVDDRRGYLDLLETIVAQGLPEHEASFLRLLRERSRDLIGDLVSDILGAPREIEERVGPVNRSLRRSPFDVGRYLRLRMKVRRTETVSRFLNDLRSVAEGGWTDDDLDSAERRFETLESIMRRLASSDHVDRTWRAHCLDTRQHVTFLAEEVDAHDRVQATYDSGAAMSGGQQQKLVIFCLAAALRYQLADTDDAYPRYGTIVLDEAFDKADTRYTRMALDIFVEFGFQMLLATPQKLLQTIEPYVGAATSIENPDRRQSVVADVTWSHRRADGSP